MNERAATSGAPAPILDVVGLNKHFPVRGRGLGVQRQFVRAVNDVSLSVSRGRTLALVGESGSGKSTLARTIVQLHPATSGSVVFDGVELTALPAAEMRRTRRHLQYVFQDPYSSLPARMTAGRIVTEGLHLQGMIERGQRNRRAVELLRLVGLPDGAEGRYPHQFSGGQRQRLAIARALATEPQLLVLDEPVSALDVSVQAQIINLLRRLQAELELAYLFIAHDLAVVRHIAHDVAVLYLGRVVEQGPTDVVLATPRHPYTRALLASVPVPDPRLRPAERAVVSGELPSPMNPPSGCAFRTRCPHAIDRCARDVPELVAVTDARGAVACHRADELRADKLRAGELAAGELGAGQPGAGEPAPAPDTATTLEAR